jgi:hypothetical protein
LIGAPPLDFGRIAEASSNLAPFLSNVWDSFVRMIEATHEVLVDLFRHQPTLATDLITMGLGLALPDHHKAQLRPTTVIHVATGEYRADATVVLTDTYGNNVLGVVVDVQMRQDPQKRFSWPVYVCATRDQLRCPVALLVMCVDPEVAAWCAEPILVSPSLECLGMAQRPLVMTSRRVPAITDEDEARRSPELAVLSAMSHRTHPDRARIQDTALSTLTYLGEERAGRYRHLISTEPRDLMLAKAFMDAMSTGIAREKARVILGVLEARDVEVPDETRKHILDCADVKQLDTWARRAATAEKVADLFG